MVHLFPFSLASDWTKRPVLSKVDRIMITKQLFVFRGRELGYRSDNVKQFLKVRQRRISPKYWASLAQLYVVITVSKLKIIIIQPAFRGWFPEFKSDHSSEQIFSSATRSCTGIRWNLGEFTTGAHQPHCWRAWSTNQVFGSRVNPKLRRISMKLLKELNHRRDSYRFL